ncbi:MAG: hypothetical protein DMD66_08125 [Gemmatimonadetes bacterium]|nr:MAG: hypothetical protein DMD66_08125 [Gemmatimonadota bacterium]
MIGRRIAAVVLAAVVAACSGTHSGGAPVATRSIDEVLADHTDSLMAIPGVVGTAIGLCDGARCIKVLVADSSAPAARRIPSRLEGYRVVVEVTGAIKPRG